ncbi:Cof-type HAD-IIB family hydrolase [Streptococcus jiangjianxini]|uniref:Cof-type HAD-IIB family hydrolase n=1 Tax=Streptococcus jiangjianxini TaxID=3161189 RepID=UPI0032F08C10
MTVKVFATDMDGSFLNSQNEYDRKRFKRVFNTIQASGARFVAISGNQYYQIRSFFKDYEKEMTIVGDNGAYIVENGRFLTSFTIAKSVIKEAITFIEREIPQARILLCGEKSAYLKSSMPQDDKDYFGLYYHRLTEVDTFDTLPDDNFLKCSINIPPEKTSAISHYFNQAFPGQMTATSAEDGNIDLIATGVHKGAALSLLLERWGLTSQELATFGDGGNDLEMLELANYSYAMANGSEKVKEVAQYQAPSNDQSGVLATIEELLKAK